VSLDGRRRPATALAADAERLTLDNRLSRIEAREKVLP
jgi:hypothetical protein